MWRLPSYCHGFEFSILYGAWGLTLKTHVGMPAAHVALCLHPVRIVKVSCYILIRVEVVDYYSPVGTYVCGFSPLFSLPRWTDKRICQRGPPVRKQVFFHGQMLKDLLESLVTCV